MEKYEKIVATVERDEDEQEVLYDDFMSEIEADPSQADLMGICQKLNQLLISLKYKQLEYKKAQEELEILKGINQ